MAYASRTGTRRNLAALRAAGWRLLLSPAGVMRTEGFAYGLDNGKWSAFTTGEPWDEAAFLRAVEGFGVDADWIVVPDIVAGGLASLELTAAWMPRLRGSCPLLLIAVQDGMAPADVAPLLGSGVGLFLGGSTDWKLATMVEWGQFAAELGVHYHVARVNTARRIRLAAAAGAASFDGSSASRFAVTLPPLERARQQPDLLAPKRRAA